MKFLLNHRPDLQVQLGGTALKENAAFCLVAVEFCYLPLVDIRDQRYPLVYNLIFEQL